MMIKMMMMMTVAPPTVPPIINGSGSKETQRKYVTSHTEVISLNTASQMHLILLFKKKNNYQYFLDGPSDGGQTNKGTEQ